MIDIAPTDYERNGSPSWGEVDTLEQEVDKLETAIADAEEERDEALQLAEDRETALAAIRKIVNRTVADLRKDAEAYPTAALLLDTMDKIIDVLEPPTDA